MSEDAGPSEGIRRTIEVSNDPRVARTRAALFAAAHALAADGEAVSVSAVVRRAGVSRASFYSHFSGLDDLASEFMADAFREIAALYTADAGAAVGDADRAAAGDSGRAAVGDAMRHSQQRLVEYFADNRALFTGAVALPLSREGYLAGVRTMAEVIEPALAEHPERPSCLRVDATARYIAGAAYGLIDAWLTGEVELTSQELVDHLVALLPPWFSGTEIRKHN